MSMDIATCVDDMASVNGPGRPWAALEALMPDVRIR